MVLALCCIVTSSAPRRHERINTRKTLIIQSCPDDDLVNLEFLDEVRFQAFVSLHGPGGGARGLIGRLAPFLQETIIRHLQKRYDELQVYTYVGDILIALNPFQNLTIYSPQVGFRDPLRQVSQITGLSEVRSTYFINYYYCYFLSNHKEISNDGILISFFM